MGWWDDLTNGAANLTADALHATARGAQSIGLTSTATAIDIAGNAVNGGSVTAQGHSEEKGGSTPKPTRLNVDIGKIVEGMREAKEQRQREPRWRPPQRGEMHACVARSGDRVGEMHACVARSGDRVGEMHACVARSSDRVAGPLVAPINTELPASTPNGVGEGITSNELTSTPKPHAATHSLQQEVRDIAHAAASAIGHGAASAVGHGAMGAVSRLAAPVLAAAVDAARGARAVADPDNANLNMNDVKTPSVASSNGAATGAAEGKA